ncbi:ABC transporter ATP-binding protein [Gluconobacter kanchanaburiensis]|uniref:Sugar ABC transporter ATP-binding protein n=1 Tax=Gluconobacter kanchanaburiensis NBRC 103587 TaxID=1307948 RepID=A0A511BA21_9PROT|nr:ABC transporter ATP-binding protein [Gluconobacter kanchanaburiensis]MBF0862881.1 ABC transporter ATP-binding protein [Gluconobacter kanchanaburiensis]GBR72006.1 O-antigen exporter ATP-binding protein [Gluconobacter kanchanaburiensis NBRC 103587]GEK97194.1 sugar ABC transporter ATP-binding protein [Gluconobacter kanchanaburiensis NBRC 103587]
MAHIRLEDISLSFPVLHGNSRSLKKTLLARAKSTMTAKTGAVGGRMRVSGNSTDVVEVQALINVSFTISEGERVGLVGHNGAGKSTLLRVLAGIYETGEGLLDIEGDTHALIDPSAGMNRELTGRENIQLFACRMGMSRMAALELEQDVETFSDLGAFFDLPVRLYSSGMSVRLGFALATVPRPRILLMDEWFMAGDQKFQDKAKARLEGMVDAAEILVVTSHALTVLREWCTRIIWMESGEIRMDGPTDDVLDAYEAAVALTPA